MLLTRKNGGSLDQLKQVIVKVHGGKYRWTWKKFKIAVQNMGCESFFFGMEFYLKIIMFFYIREHR